MDKTIKDLRPNARNPRKITDEKLNQLKKALIEFGDLSGIIYNIRTKRIVGGHQRTKLIDDSAEIVREHTYNPPTNKGTVSEGYIIFDGEQLKYREVDWDENKEKAANICANRNAGQWDQDELKSIFNELYNVNYDLDLTMFDIIEVSDFIKIDKIDTDEHWQGLPTYEQEDNSAYRSLIVHCETKEDLDSFLKLVDQEITDKTKYIYYPKKDRRSSVNTFIDNDSDD